MPNDTNTSNASYSVWDAAGLELSLPRRLTLPDAWVGHLPFALWIVENFRPEQIVELGVHTGNSYCSFCEAVDRLNLSTQCAGVDHWMGDAQAGYYGDEIYEELKSHHDPRYSRFSRLLRMGFDDALAQFPDGSVDLLHIDGFHTYEAVSHDFLTWKPKLSARSIVLFHDTNVFNRNFGVWKFFEEIGQEFPTFNFLHSNGLGVAYTGQGAIPPQVENLFSKNAGSVDKIRSYFSRLGAELLTQLDSKRIRQRLNDLSKAAFTADRYAYQLANERDQIVVLKEDVNRARFELSKQQAHLSAVETRYQQKLDQIQHALDQQVVRWNALSDQTTDMFGLPLEEFQARLSRVNQPNSRRRKVLRLAVTRVLNEATKGPIAEEAPTLNQASGAEDAALLQRDAIIATGLFDPEFYQGSAEALLQGVDPLVHYLTIGESKGFAPSRLFDPVYYAARYPDVAATGYGLLRHYVEYGRQENRECIPRSAQLNIPKAQASDKKSLLIVLDNLNHSRENSLVLTFLKEGVKSNRIYIYANESGPWSKEFSEACDGLYILPGAGPKLDGENRTLAQKLSDALTPDVTMMFGMANYGLCREFSAKGVPVVSYIHDQQTSLYDIYNDTIFWSAHTVFSSQTIAEKIAAVFPKLRTIRNFEFIPIAAEPFPPLPPFGVDATCDAVRAYLRPETRQNAFVVAVDGDIIYYSLLLATIAELRRVEPMMNVRFVWLGDPAATAKFAPAVAAAGLEPWIVVDEIAPYNQIALRNAQAVLLMPGYSLSSLDYVQALRSGLPVLSLSNGDEVSEWLSGDSRTSALVLDPLDHQQAAQKIAQWATDQESFAAVSESSRDMAAASFAPSTMYSRLESACRTAIAVNKQIQADADRAIRGNG